MGAFKVQLVRGPKWRGQAFHVRICDAGNGRKLFSSEKYRDRHRAWEMCSRVGLAFGDGTIIEDLT